MQDAFAEFSKQYVLFCHITTRVAGDPYQELLHEKGGHGFPYLAYMDAEGEVLVEPAGRSVEAFRNAGKECDHYVRVGARAKAGEAGARVEYALLQMEFGKLALEEGLAALEKAELSKEQKVRLDRVKVEAEIAAILGSIEDEASSDAAGGKFYRLVKAGRDGPERDQDRYTFYVLVLHAAEEKKDAVVFERAYRELHAAFKGYPGAAAFLKVVELRLAELKKK